MTCLTNNQRIYHIFQLTKSTIVNIDRNEHRLGLNLEISPLNVTCYDFIDNAEGMFENYLKTDTEPKTEEIAVKIEAKTLNINENTVDNLNDNHDSSEPIKETDVGNDNYLTDDLPSEIHDTKKSKNNSVKRKKEHKSKKRKLNISNLNAEFKNSKDDIENTLSDDEPLANISKVIDKENVKKKFPKNFNVDYFEDYATVVFLTPEDARRELLLRKDSLNYKNSPYKCELCYRGYEAKAAFENHKKRHRAVS